MLTKFIDNGSDELILFFLGWGMDANPMMHLKSHRSILYVYDYSNLELDFDFSKYEKIHLLAFSCGVFIAGYLKESLPEISSSAAINGTFKLFDSEYGLSSDIIDVFKNISLDNYMDFRRNYLLETEAEVEKFRANTPLRTIESSLAELEKLEEIYCDDVCFNFDKAFAGVSDKIFPFEMQKSFWMNYSNIITPLKGSHFLFFNNECLEEFLPTLCL